MKRIMPLRRVVTEVTYEAVIGDDVGIRRAIKSWHNRLSNGSIPRSIIKKLGRELFLDIEAWEEWWSLQDAEKNQMGRPRTQLHHGNSGNSG